MLQYLFQVILFQLVFLLMFELLLKKETFFTYNRWYLLLTPVISLLLPLFNIEELSAIVPAEAMVALPDVIIGSAAETGRVSELSFSNPGDKAIKLWYILYFMGALGSAGLFFKKYQVLRQLFRNKVVSEEAGLKIIEVSNSRLACTFFNSIFLGDQLSQEQREQILSHELVHVTQKHSYDLLYFEIFRILFWFNPLIYIYQSKISALHEFIADAGVVKTVEKRTYYQQLLNTAFNTENISFINQFFNQSLIKKRIVMLQKSRSKTSAKIKFLFLVPLLLGMLVYVSCSNEPDLELEEDINVVQKGEKVELQVKNIRNLTKDETAKRNQIFDYLGTEGHPNTLVITDGESSENITVIKNASTSSIKTVVGKPLSQGNEDVPFMLIEEVPVFPGCEDLASNLAQKQCLTDNITTYVTENFNTALGKELGLKGINKIHVQFRINTNGEVEVLGVRGPEPELEKEAERVVLGLPRMEPGKHNGKAVGVLYSLPIVFRVGD